MEPMHRPLILLVDDNRELADLLSQVFQEAGYRTRVCYRGRAALEAIDAEAPDAAVVDMLLPDVMGTEVGKVLAQRAIPFVFATGVFKGRQHARDAEEKYGARAHFEKPFAAGSLLAAMKEIVAPPPPAEAASDESMEVELDIDVETEPDATPMAPLEMTGQVALRGPMVQAVLRGDDFRLEAPLRGQTLVRTGPIPTQPQQRVQRGALRDNLPQLVTAFWLLQETGELWLQRGKVKKAIWFEKGAPVFALSNLAADRFGTFLVRLGRITPEQLREATARAVAEKRRTGDVLVAMGVLQDAERLYYVAQQVKAILYSLFAWSDGEYVMTFQSRAAMEPLRLGLHPAQLISRGIKKLYGVDRLQRLLLLEDRLAPSPEPAYQLADAGLEPWEEQLLARIDGERTVAELLAMSGKPREVVYAALAVLLALRFVEKS
ncbi:response regulator transcription factor [Vulgatibacter sp.]|uniref:response regulator transcription factor n=1 Tax=Vulgatibacter sp. TaxID=1971226 RepID=UPI0035645C9F